MEQVVQVASKAQQVRQGDVLITPSLKPIDPADIGDLIKDGDGKRIVLAYGEVTGHAHAFYPHQDNAAWESANDALQDNAAWESANDALLPPVSLYQLSNPQQYSGSTLPAKGQRLLRLRERALLRHEEHNPISLPPGDYIVIQQHEGDEIQELRKVAD